MSSLSPIHRSTPRGHRDATRALQRAVSDYLAVSRGADLYDTTGAYLDAEAGAWLLLCEATGPDAPIRVTD